MGGSIKIFWSIELNDLLISMICWFKMNDWTSVLNSSLYDLVVFVLSSSLYGLSLAMQLCPRHVSVSRVSSPPLSKLAGSEAGALDCACWAASVVTSPLSQSADAMQKTIPVLLRDMTIKYNGHYILLSYPVISSNWSLKKTLPKA